MKINKAYEITDAKISFVSLVDKAANKRKFLITKGEDSPTFQTYGRIIKVDEETHYVTGIVYEPMTEDAHDNYMTEEEIRKAAYWFAKNGDSVDIQHNFEAADGVTVVENWVTKSDEVIEGEEIKKGTWLITAEITDPDIWEQVTKGDFTGFSMGGVGKYSTEDVEIEATEEGGEEVSKAQAPANTEQKGILKKLAEMFGLDVVEKGAMSDQYNARIKSTRFWTAFHVLEDLLYRYNWTTDKWEYEADETKIREALEEFSTIITEVLTEQSIAKALQTDQPIEKAGKKMSKTNKEKLDSIVQAITDFKEEFEDNEDDVAKANNPQEEESEVKKDDIQKMIDEAIQKALNPEEAGKETELSQESVEKMITDSIQKALEESKKEVTEEVKKEALTTDKVQEMITKALEPIIKQRALPSNLNDETAPVEKSENRPSYINW